MSDDSSQRFPPPQSPAFAELDAMLAAASAHEPKPEELAGLTRRLAAALPLGALPAPAPAPTSPPAPGPASTATGGATAAVVKVGVGVGLLAIASGAFVATREPPAVGLAPNATVTQVQASPVPLPIVEASSPLDAPAVPSAPASTTKRPRAFAGGSASAEPAIVRPEATILAEAHNELLHGSAQRALALVDEHARTHPKGALVQEREVVAIEALLAAGRREEARRRAAVFRERYPTSSHVARIDRLLGAD